MVPNDNNSIWDIFLWEKIKAFPKRVSLTADGKEREQGNESANRVVFPAISGNGRYIAFATTATNMVPGDANNFQDIFVYDILSTPPLLLAIPMMASRAMAIAQLGRVIKLPFHIMDVG